MSAKPSRKQATPSVPAAAAAPAGSAAPAPFVPWIDSTDPRRRRIGQVVLVGVWLYVAALWFLALDQTFNWGIFGPKIPPLP
jgi:hypothetical protein